MKTMAMALAILVLYGSVVWAQNVYPDPSSDPCRNVGINLQGASNADITADNTAGGVLVMAANVQRCGALITNSSANDMRCARTGVTASSTVGYFVRANTTLELGPEGKDAWRCIRTGGSSATVSVLEKIP